VKHQPRQKNLTFKEMIMVQRIANLWRRPIVRIVLAMLLLLILGGAAGGIYWTQIPPEQPIQFPHSLHVGLGADCQYCHPSGRWGPTASLPTSAKCWACHQQIQRQSPELDKLAGYVERNEQIPWVPVAIVPDFAHFTHQPHLAADIACQDCHGNVAEMGVAEPTTREMNMGWCLGCHNDVEDPERVAELTDCSTCHY